MLLSICVPLRLDPLKLQTTVSGLTPSNFTSCPRLLSFGSISDLNEPINSQNIGSSSPVGIIGLVPNNVCYSPVISADCGIHFLKTLLKIRLYGFRQVKLKVEGEYGNSAGQFARRVLGRRVDIRADANMAWDVEQALTTMRDLSKYGMYCFEQPIASGI